MTYGSLAGLSMLGDNPPMTKAAPAEPARRRRNAAATRAKILEAAQEAFADLGYSQAGIRHIAALAGVDSALVKRYFGSKANLFEEAFTTAVEQFYRLDPSAYPDFGAMLANEFASETFDITAQSIILLSTNDPEARAIVARVLERITIAPMATVVGAEKAEVRAVRLLMLATGYTLFTRQIPLMSLQSAHENGTSNWLSQLIQQIVEA
jgi:AcrR family transcriptional regulator